MVKNKYGTQHLTAETPVVRNGMHILKMSHIFTKYIHYSRLNDMASIFNCIYRFSGSDEVGFACCAIKSPENISKYLFAYDETRLEEDDMFYFVKRVFYHTYLLIDEANKAVLPSS